MDALNNVLGIVHDVVRNLAEKRYHDQANATAVVKLPSSKSVRGLTLKRGHILVGNGGREGGRR